MDTVKEIGDELYRLPPQAFVAARDGYVAEAKNTGDRAVAAELAAMRRPTMSAWLVNLLALRRAEAVATLIELGETIRGAQGTVPGTQLRDLSAQRRKEIGELLAQATLLAAEAGESALTKQHLSEVESTLAAAMADHSSARLVQSGRVVKTLTYSGFGQVSLPGGLVAAGAGGGKVAEGASAPGEAQGLGAVSGLSPAARTAAPVVDLEARRADARARLDRARGALADAVQAEQEANSGSETLVAQIAELQGQLDAAQRNARTARQARLAAERDAASAERRLAALDRA